MAFPVRAAPAHRPSANFCTPVAPLRITLTVLLLASAIHAPTPSQAQTIGASPTKPDSFDTDRLAPVNVTATRMPARIDETVAETTLLNRAVIERATGRTFSEFLAQQPGLQMSSNGGLGQYSSIFIRGMDARHTLLLVDGMRLGSATVGVPSLDNLPLELIDRIEIVRGPLSSVYGSDPAGGVIQVFSRRAREGLTPNASLTLGSNRYRQFSAGLAFGQGAFDGAFQVVQTATNSFSATNPNVLFDAYNPDTDPYRQTAGNLRLGWQLSQDWRVDASALQSNALVNYDDGPDVNTRAKLRNGVQTLSASGRVSANWSTRLSYGHSTDVYETVESFYGPYAPVKTDQQQFAWENTIPTPVGTLLALVERIEQKVSQPETTYAVDRRTIDAVGLGISGEYAAHAWQAAIRQDRNSQFGNQNTGSVGYAFAFTPNWRAGLSYGTSFIAPSFNQLYYPGFGNPDLQPEEGRHGEVHLRWNSGAHSLRAAWVDNRIQGYIPSGPKPANVPNTQIDGLVMSYEGRFSGVLLGASYEHLDPRNITEGDEYGKLLPRRAKEAFRARADWDLGAYRLGATVSAFSQRFDDAANTLRLAGFATVDLRADWLISSDLTLGIRLNNLAGKVYETAYGYNQPGREGYLTLRWAPR